MRYELFITDRFASDFLMGAHFSSDSFIYATYDKLVDRFFIPNSASFAVISVPNRASLWSSVYLTARKLCTTFHITQGI